MIDLQRINSIINKLSLLPSVKQQYILNWLSVRYLAVIFKKCETHQIELIKKNMSKKLIESVFDEIKTFGRELLKPVLVEAVFVKLEKAINDKAYSRSLKDTSYKVRKKNN